MKAKQLGSAPSNRSRRRRASVVGGGLERLEDRQLLSTFTVTNPNASGPGSLRSAIALSNASPGPDTVDFAISGTIRVGRGSLPAITDPVNLDGSSAPGFAGTPVVTVDFHGTRGLRFAPGSDGSTLSSLSLVRAGNAGVTLDASHVTVQGNFIGLLADGQTAAGNRGDGIRINPSSRFNLIGHSDPVSSISYYNADSISMQPVSGWQGIRATSVPGQYLITGTSGDNGLLFVGPISGVGGKSFAVNVPGAKASSVYGPDDLGNGQVRLVGSYKTGNDQVQGFLFQGSTDDLSNSANYTTIDYPGAKFNYVHSTMGNLAVGNADGPEGNLPIGTGHAFLWDVSSKAFLPDIVYPGSSSTTAYGIWQNGQDSYTIVGGYTMPGDADGVGHGYLVDYDARTGQFTHWTSLDDPHGVAGQNIVTHFEGISSDQKGVYTLSADSAQVGSNRPLQGSLVTIRRNTDGSFGPSSWVDLNYPGTTGITSSNSVAGTQVVGIVIGAGGTFSYQTSVNVGFQLSNVISGNRGNGIGLYGATDSRISMNNIGTDVTGNRAIGNGRNGVLLTQGASRNFLGGQATNGNDPTSGVFARPPQGNLISGNQGNGVLINGGSTRNTLSGNFIGTAAAGSTALGNRLDGVSIDHADFNDLIGCTFQQNPFVFYNVISGNGGNGLRIHSSNHTTVHANFLGVGANNATVVANHGDGLLISGTSQDTQVGGVIPLGNVISGNDRHGTEIRDRASGTVNFNTFAGLFAFGAAAPNKLDGFLVTSTGGNNLIRTCIASGNLGHGIEITGQATGVQVEQTSAGTNTSINTALPNGGSGIVISGQAHDNAIGGFNPSIEPQTTLSSNGRYGIEIIGHAHNNRVFHTVVGTGAGRELPLGNGLGGIYLGSGTSGNTIGGAGFAQNKVADNGGFGIVIQGSRDNVIQGTEVSSNALGGLRVDSASGNQIGSAVAGNTISTNTGDGLVLSGNVSGSRVQFNQISQNSGSGVNLQSAKNLLVGGLPAGLGNHIDSNRAYGILASGNCGGTVLQNNVTVANPLGNVNLTRSRGITFLP